MTIELGTLYSFGYKGLGGSDDLRRLLEGTDIETIVDVRLSVWSGNRAFSLRTRDTVEGIGLRYVGMRALGNLAYKTGGIQIADIEAIEVVLEYLRTPANVALMCVCALPDHCHRLALCEEAVRRQPDLRVVHLTRPAAFLSADATDEHIEAFTDALLPMP